ncbi:PseG/SpsG family protein [Leptospira santarosai]|uniref:PseG/SpsG family protein n=1 Tax=Leptospira santarosai TaxID=28183 RepID=UPI000774552D|nr:glycosyltransferase [Leptospira santarosai]
MNNKVFIFTECLAFTGLGHLSRCVALAEIFQEKGCDVEVILHTDGTVFENGSVIRIRDFNWKDKGILANFLNMENPKIVFVDSYLADIQVYEYIFRNVTKLICIDDTNRIPYPEKSIILNPGLGGTYLDYNKERNKIFTGIEYVLLKKPFREYRKNRKTKQDLENIMISMGGSDSKNLTYKILSMVSQFFPKISKEVIIGPGFENKEYLESQPFMNARYHKNLTAEEIKNIMESTDLCISAGGQTVYELGRLGVPIVLIKTADNQLGNLNGLRNMNIINNYLDSEENEFENKLSKEILSLTSFRLRQKMSQVLMANFVAQSSQVFDSILY